MSVHWVKADIAVESIENDFDRNAYDQMRVRPLGPQGWGRSNLWRDKGADRWDSFICKNPTFFKRKNPTVGVELAARGALCPPVAQVWWGRGYQISGQIGPRTGWAGSSGGRYPLLAQSDREDVATRSACSW
jgi:hypothetical protein